MRSIRVFPEFLVDPYYEPPAWFMIPKSQGHAYLANQECLCYNFYVTSLSGELKVAQAKSLLGAAITFFY